MKNLYRQFFWKFPALLLMLFAITVTTLGQTHPGMVRIKVSEQLARQLEHASISRTSSGEVVTGVQSLDVLNRQYHVRRLSRNARHTDAVVVHGGNCAGDMCSMVVRGDHIFIRDEAISMDIVDIPIAIIVNLVAGDLSVVYPHVCRKIGVVRLDAAVSHGNDDVAFSGLDFPGIEETDVGARKASRLTGVVIVPLTR